MLAVDQIVPWGRSYDEYCRMFHLSETDMSGRILGCGDGPASFNSIATKQGSKVVSCDPIYRFDADGIRSRIAATYETVIEQTRQYSDRFVWSSIRSIEELGEIRMNAMNDFLDDFEYGRSEGRYVEASLPKLPFDDLSFDLALSSHFLFLYSDHLDERFHRASIREMCRVAKEVRLFPLLTLASTPSRFVDTISSEFGSDDFEISIETVPYEFQRNGNRMMRIRRKSGS